MDFQQGDLVMFRDGLYSDEERAVYRITEVNGDRCFLVLINSQMPIPPQSVALLSDLWKLPLWQGWGLTR